MVLDVAELLWKHRTAKAKGATISVTLSLQPLLRQISQPWAAQPLRELGETPGTAPAAAPFGSGVIVILDMLKYCLEGACAVSHQQPWCDSEPAALRCKHRNLEDNAQSIHQVQ